MHDSQSDSEQIEADSRLFLTIRKRNVSTDHKLRQIKRHLTKSPKSNINAQDSNNDENTPLHVAVKRNDVEVVKLLIANGADVTITNKTGLTPLAFAEKYQCSRDIFIALKTPINKEVSTNHSSKNIEQLLNNEAIQSISRCYVEEFDSTDLPQSYPLTITRNNKILKINILTIEKALSFMQDKLFIEMYNESTHLFLIIVNVPGTINDLDAFRSAEDTLHLVKPLEGILDKRKPIIIQWQSLCSVQCHIMFREPHKCFELIKNDWGNSLTEEELIEELTPDGSFRFPLLLKALHFNFGGTFNGNLLDTSFDVDREFDAWRFIDYAARSDDALSLRFLLLVNWALSSKNKDDRRVLEIAAQYASPQTISAILNLSTSDEPGELPPSCWQRTALTLRNSNNYTPLVIATLVEKTETLNFLINCGVRQDYEIAIDLAWSNQRYDKVLLLLMAEAPFPNEFELNGLPDNEITRKLRKFAKDREDFHKAIEENAQDMVRHFMIDFIHSKQAFNPKNQSAIITALNTNQYEVLAILQLNGFCIGENEKWELNDEQKEELRQAKSKYFRKQENSHITFLLSKSKVAHKGEYFSKIKELYEQLDDIPLVSTVLKVLEQSNVHEIIFDFHKDSVVDIDPTQSGSGTADHVAGRLCVGAKQPTETLLGTLAHELTHFAMQTVYNNESNPYSASDEKTKTDFQQIVDRYETIGNIDDIINRVYKNYRNPCDWPSELIVRVNHLLAHYRKDEKRLESIKEKAGELFNFYNERIQQELTKFLEKPTYFKNQYLNILLQHLDKIQQCKIRLNSSCLLANDVINSEVSLILTCSLPQIITADLYQSLQRQGDMSFIRGHYIFALVGQFRNQDMVLRIRNSFKSDLKQTLVVDCSSEYDSARDLLWATIRNFSKQQRIIFITDRLVAQTLVKDKIKAMEIRLVEKEYKWTDFQIEYQRYLLTHSVDFQGYTTALNELVSVDSHRANFLPLIDLLDDNCLKISEPLPTSYGYDESYYIERTINVTTTESFQRYSPTMLPALLERIKKEKVLLLADRAGMGKSTLLTHLSKKIKEREPTLWIMRFSLSNHTEAFEEEKRQKKLGAIEFLCTKLLKLRSVLEKQIFAEMLDRRKIILMFDGFDEISPFYKNVVLNLLEDLKKSKILQLWITTRPYLSTDLIHKLQPISCTLQPFSVNDQIEFLTKFWYKSVGAKDDKIKTFAVNLIKKISNSIKDRNREFASIPLQTRMLAEAFDQDLIDFCNKRALIPTLPAKLDLLEIYKRFVHRKYLVYIFEKNNLSKINLAREDLANILSGGVNLRKIHQQLALQVLFPRNKDDLLKYNKKRTLKPEELNRIGIVQRNSDKLDFVHRTFSEYYAGDFFMNQLPKYRTSSIIADFFLDTILLDEPHGVIRSFTNSLLESPEFQVSKEILIWYGQKIDELWKKGYLRDLDKATTILHIAVREGNTNIVDFLLCCLIAANCLDTGKELFEANDKYGKSVWVIPGENGYVDVLNLLWMKYRAICGREAHQMKDLLICQSSRKQTSWAVAVALNQIEIFEGLLEYAKQILLSANEFVDLLLKEDDYAFCIWYRAALRGQAWVYKKLLIFAKEMKCPPAILRQLLLAVQPDQDETVWYFAALGGSPIVFNMLRDWAEEAQFQLADIKAILCHKNRFGQTVWHDAVSCNSPGIKSELRRWMRDIGSPTGDSENTTGILQQLWNLARDTYLNVEEQENILLGENQSGETVWHLLIKHRDDTVANHLVTLIKQESLINSRYFFRVLLTRKFKTESLWWTAVKTRNTVIIDCVWQWICQADLAPEEIKTIIAEKEQREGTAWHIVVASCNINMIDNLWKYAETLKLNSMELKNMLFEKNCREQTVWHVAIMSNDLRIFNKLVKLMKDFLPTPEEFMEFLSHKPQFGNTTWQQLLTLGHHAILNRLLDFVESRHCNQLIVSVNEDEETAFHLSAKLKTRNMFDTLLKWTEKGQMNQENIKELLSRRDKTNRTPLSRSIREKNLKVALGLLELGSNIEELDEKQCKALSSFINHGKTRYGHLISIIEEGLGTLLKRNVEKLQEDPETDDEECIFDMF